MGGDNQPVTRREFNDLRAQVKENTELTRDIHAIIRSFRILGMIAKWVGWVAGALVAVKTGIGYLKQ